MEGGYYGQQTTKQCMARVDVMDNNNHTIFTGRMDVGWMDNNNHAILWRVDVIKLTKTITLCIGKMDVMENNNHDKLRRVDVLKWKTTTLCMGKIDVMDNNNHTVLGRMDIIDNNNIMYGEDGCFAQLKGWISSLVLW